VPSSDFYYAINVSIPFFHFGKKKYGAISTRKDRDWNWGIRQEMSDGNATHTVHP
jgi:hypothetical protein